MKIRLLTLVDNNYNSVLGNRLLAWLRSCLIAWHTDPEALNNDRVPVLSLAAKQRINFDQGTLVSETITLNKLPRRLFFIRSSETTITHVLVYAQEGWDVIKSRAVAANIHYHWIGHTLPKDWQYATGCTFYVPEFTIEPDAKAHPSVRNLVPLAYLPGCKLDIGSTWLPVPNTDNSAFFMDACSNITGSCETAGLSDTTIERITDELSVASIPSPTLLNTFDTPIVDDHTPLSLDNIQLDSVEIVDCEHKLSCYCYDYSTTQPDMYYHGLLHKDNYYDQYRMFLHDPNVLLVAPASATTCLFELIRNKALIACRERIWVAMKKDDSSLSSQWVKKYHDQGYYHLVYYNDETCELKYAPKTSYLPPVNLGLALHARYAAFKQGPYIPYKPSFSSLFNCCNTSTSTIRPVSNDQPDNFYPL